MSEEGLQGLANLLCRFFGGGRSRSDRKGVPPETGGAPLQSRAAGPRGGSREIGVRRQARDRLNAGRRGIGEGVEVTLLTRIARLQMFERVA
jgi:hypothetical protein